MEESFNTHIAISKIKASTHNPAILTSPKIKIARKQKDPSRWQDFQERLLVLAFTVLFRKAPYLLQSMQFFGHFIKMEYMMNVEMKSIMEFL